MADSKAMQPRNRTVVDLAPQYREEQTMTQMIWRSYRRHRPAMVGTVIVLIFALTAALAPYLTPYDPENIELTIMLQPPLIGAPDGDR